LRLFIALEIPDAVRQAVGTIVERLRPAAPAARWTRIEGIHITLKFIGQVKPEVVRAIETALAGIRSDGPVHVSFRGLGFFPNERRPRVFWAGVQASSNTAAMAASIDERLAPLGIASETRAFSPHLTLARFEDERGESKLIDAIDKVGSVDLGQMTTTEFHVFESKPQRGGSRYSILNSFDFVKGTPGPREPQS